MAVRKIETTISLDGEQAFKQALSAATREMRVMESELKAVSAAYDTNGNAADFYAQKQSNLRNQISQQRQIVESLERAVKDAGEAYGESSSQVDAYSIRLNNARTRMARLEKELQETDREVEELGRDSVRAGRQLEDGIGEGAQNAESSLKSLISTMQQDIGSIKTSAAVTAVTGLWDLATSAYSSIAGFVEGTAEYRKQLSFLEMNAELNGFDFDKIKGQLVEVTGLTGDSSAAIEGLSNLLAAGVDERQLEVAIDGLAGAVISFPDTLKFESLADGLQETIATGAATGQFAELLERLGVDLETFNAALQASDTAAGDLDIALSYLAYHGMNDVYEKWQETNGTMNEAAQTQAELELELAEFGGTLEKYITTPVKQLLVEALQWVNQTVEDVEQKGVEEGVNAAMQRLDQAVQSPYEKMVEQAQSGTLEPNAIGNFVTWWGELTRGELGAGKTIKDVVTAAGSLWETIGTSAGGLFSNVLSGLGNEELAAKNATKEVKEQLQQEADVFEAAVKGWGDFNDNVQGTAQTIRRVTETLKQDVKAQKELAKEAESISFEAPDGTQLEPIGVSEKWKAVIEEVKQGNEQLQAAGQEAGTAVTTGITQGVEQGAEQLQVLGQQAGTAVTTGFDNATTDWSSLFPEEVVIDMENAIPAMEGAGQGMGEGLAEGLESTAGDVSGASSELMMVAIESVGGLHSAGFDAGAQYGASLAAGLLSQVSYVSSAAGSLSAAAQVNIPSAGVSRGGYSSGSSGVINTVLNIDGRSFASATSSYFSTALAVRA